MQCQVCHKNSSSGVAAVPGIPISLAWCSICLLKGCSGPYALHWTNLSLVVSPDDVMDEDYFALHKEIVDDMANGQYIRRGLFDMIVWRDGYKTMREALADGPPKENEA